jgi:hypothetical protein
LALLARHDATVRLWDKRLIHAFRDHGTENKNDASSSAPILHGASRISCVLSHVNPLAKLNTAQSKDRHKRLLAEQQAL